MSIAIRIILSYKKYIQYSMSIAIRIILSYKKVLINTIY